MIKDTQLGFTIEKTFNEVVITKIDVKKIEVQLISLNSCLGDYEDTFSKILSVEDKISIKIPFKDGEYKVRITSTDIASEDFTIVEYKFSSYTTTLVSFIRDIKDQLCGCACQDCGNDCGDQVKQLNSISFKMLSLILFNKDLYFYLQASSKCINCDLLEVINCFTAQELFLGKTKLPEDYKKVLGYFYYILYLAEKSTTTSNIKELNEFFNINKIINCLLKLNIDIKCIENSILTSPNYKIGDTNNLIKL